MDAQTRFWNKVRKTDRCWYWTASLREHGYGQMWWKGKAARKAHRIAWEIANGDIPDGMAVLHRCDTPSCVRPDHLFLGTQADNMRDMAAKGRARQAFGIDSTGTANVNAKLTPDRVREIRQAFRDGVSMKELVQRYSMHDSTLYDVINGVTWKHVAA